MKVMIESDLGTEFRTHQDRIDNRAFFPKLPNSNGLDNSSKTLTQ